MPEPPDDPLLRGHKPKASAGAKIACLCDSWPVPDRIAPLFFHTLRRKDSGVEPANEVEERLFGWFDHLEKSEREAIEGSRQAYEEAAEAHPCLFEPDLVSLSVEHPVDAVMLAQAWMEEGLIFAADQLTWRPVCSPGLVRPWATTAPGFGAPGEEFPIVTAPWPFICAVQGLRTAFFIPPISAYDPQEYEQTCAYTMNATTGEVTQSCQYTPPPCRGYPKGSACLQIPTTRAGQSVELTGFNFASASCRVVLRKRDDTAIRYDLQARVCGDLETPAAEVGGGTLADCRVTDKVSFRAPDRAPDGVNPFLPGVYLVDVVVPNESGFVLANGTQPATFSTENIVAATGLLEIRPPAGLPYRIWSYRSQCYDETDGEWGSDEIAIRAVVASFSMIGDQPQPPSMRIVPDLSVMDDADGGERWDFDWRLLGVPGAGEAVTGILAIALIGFEVDSEDAYRDQIRSWTDAFVRFLEEVWDLIKDKIKDIVGQLVGLGWPWGVIVGAIAIAVTLGVAAIYAAWAPADLMLRDLMVFDEEQLYGLTLPSAPLPPVSTTTIEDVDIERLPESKVAYLYTEERRYRSRSEGSDYGLWLAVQRS